MSLISWEFAALTGVAAGVAWLLPHRYKNGWLLLVSLAFYATYDWRYVAILAGVTLVNFLLARRVEKGAPRARLWLGIGVALNLATLIAFKGFDWWAPVAASLAGAPPDALKILLPVGLSFTLLQTISTLVDVSRGQLAAPRSLIDFALYLAYFPKLTAGPIERARTFLPQLQSERAITPERLARAAWLIALGLLRKVVLAEAFTIAAPVRVILDPTGAGENALSLWIRLLAYGFALYNDFAGYSSLARGVSLLMGIELSPNFLTPYFSRNFTEFWNQWHISLSHWLRDYIFFPVSRALLRRNPDPRWLPNILIPPLLTMIASGLWHFFRVELIVWGALHGLYLAVERLIAVWRPGRPPNREPRWWQAISGLAVFLLAMLTWLPFRTSMTGTEAHLRALFDWSRPVEFVPYAALAYIGFGLALDAIQYWGKDELVFLRWPLWARSAAMAFALILTAFTLAQGDVGVFIYQRF